MELSPSSTPVESALRSQLRADPSWLCRAQEGSDGVQGHMAEHNQFMNIYKSPVVG